MPICGKGTGSGGWRSISSSAIAICGGSRQGMQSVHACVKNEEAAVKMS